MIKIGQSIHAWWVQGDLDKLDEEIREIELAGADSCELILHGLDVVIGGRIIDSRLNEVLDILSNHNLEYTLHLPYNLNVLDRKMFEQYLNIFLAGIAFAKAAKIGVIVYHPGTTKIDDAFLFLKEAGLMRQLSREAPDILFCMENQPLFNNECSVAKSADSMIEFCKHVNTPNFKLTFDVGHSFLAHQGDKRALLNDLDKLLPYIGHIHLHDNYGLKEQMRDYDANHRIITGAADLHLPLGWGDIPIVDILNKLENYNGIINLEIEHRFRNQYKECIAFIRQCLAKSNLQYPAA